MEAVFAGPLCPVHVFLAPGGPPQAAALRGEEPPFPAPKALSIASSATLHLPSPQEGSRGSVGLTVSPRSMWLLG